MGVGHAKDSAQKDGVAVGARGLVSPSYATSRLSRRCYSGRTAYRLPRTRLEIVVIGADGP